MGILILIGVTSLAQLGRIYYKYADMRPWFSSEQPWKLLQYSIPSALCLYLITYVVTQETAEVFPDIIISFILFVPIFIIFEIYRKKFKRIMVAKGLSKDND